MESGLESSIAKSSTRSFVEKYAHLLYNEDPSASITATRTVQPTYTYSEPKANISYDQIFQQAESTVYNYSTEPQQDNFTQFQYNDMQSASVPKVHNITMKETLSKEAYNDPNFLSILNSVIKPLNMPVDIIQMEPEWPSSQDLGIIFF